MKLVLASTSPYRKELLSRLGLEFTCIEPRVDEENLKVKLGNYLLYADISPPVQ